MAYSTFLLVMFYSEVMEIIFFLSVQKFKNEQYVTICTEYLEN